MLGTLNGALEVRGIPVPPENISATVRGVNEVQGKIPVLTRIEIDYTLRIPADAREKVDRALATHQEKCPTACSLQGAVDISWNAEIIED